MHSYAYEYTRMRVYIYAYARIHCVCAVNVFLSGTVTDIPFNNTIFTRGITRLGERLLFSITKPQ